MASPMGIYSERPRGAGFRSVNPAERWRENRPVSQYFSPSGLQLELRKLAHEL